MIGRLEVSYAVEGEPHKVRNAADRSRTTYRRAGLVPYASLGTRREDYPLIRFPWKEVSQSLRDLAGAAGPREPVHLAYVNPETGEECLPILGFSAQMLRPGEEVTLPRRSCSSVLHVIEGRGESAIDGTTLRWDEGDTVAIPTYADVRHRATGPHPAFIFHVDDAPLHRKLRIYEEMPTAALRSIPIRYFYSGWVIYSRPSRTMQCLPQEYWE